jgi:hypothetical protein
MSMTRQCHVGVSLDLGAVGGVAAAQLTLAGSDQPSAKSTAAAA